jgi:hypothetical protein
LPGNFLKIALNEQFLIIPEMKKDAAGVRWEEVCGELSRLTLSSAEIGFVTVHGGEILVAPRERRDEGRHLLGMR